MSDLISRQAAIKAINSYFGFNVEEEYGSAVQEVINGLPPAQPDARLKKIADLVDGSIDHFDKDDAMDLLYQIKRVLKYG